MAEKRKRFNLSLKLIIILVILLPILFSGQNIVLIKMLRTAISSAYDDFSMQLAQSRAAEISKWVCSYFGDMRLFSENPIVKTGDPEQVVSWLMQNNSLKSMDMEYVFFCGKDGEGHLAEGGGANVIDRDYYDAIMNKGKETFISAPVTSRGNGKTLFHIVRAVHDASGDIFGFFAGTITTDVLQHLVSNIKVGKSGFVYIIDSNGQIMAHPEENVVMQGSILDSDMYSDEMKDITQSMMIGETGSANYQLNKKTYHMYYAPIEGTSGWSLALVIPGTQFNAISDNMNILILVVGVSVGIILLITLIIFISKAVKPLNFVEKTITGIAAGGADLTKQIDIKTTNDEVGGLVSGFNGFVTKLRNIITNVKSSKEDLITIDKNLQISIHETTSAITEILANIDNVGNQINNQASSVEETASAVTQIAQNIESLEKMIINQSAGVSQASAAIEEMMSNINSVDNSVEKMVSAFSLLDKDTKSGAEKQHDVNDRIVSIENQSAMLQEANAAIASIASQTNLLAMNAAIEAAHAGEAGKGFSVVADEIRKLSETSSMQSKTIGEELNNIQDSIISVVEASKASEEAFNSVSERIKETDTIVKQIQAAMDEQQEGSKQIFDALKTMNESTSEVKSASLEMASGNKAILEEIKLLQDVTGEIKGSISEMKVGAKEINTSSSNLDQVSGEVKQAITEIGKEIDQFIV